MGMTGVLEVEAEAWYLMLLGGTFIVTKSTCSSRKRVPGNLHLNSQEMETSQGSLLTHLR